MDVLSSLNFKDSNFTLHNSNDFPRDPQKGQLVLVNNIVYIYVDLSGFTTWYPLSNETSYFLHYQSIVSTSWIITHNLNTSDFIFFVYDENKKLVQPSYNNISDNQFELIFTQSTKGRAVVFVAAQRYSPTISSDDLASQQEYLDLVKRVKQIELGLI